MAKFQTFMSSELESFITFRKATGVWSNNYELNLSYFIRFCSHQYPNAIELTQEMVDTWCAKRAEELNNSCRSRIYPVLSFLDYLRKRGKTDVLPPDIPKYSKCKYIPHAFSHDELYRFFQACDNLPVTKNSIVHRSRKITIPVFFRLLYSSGIRTCEARMLRVEDVDLEEGVLSVQHSKGLSQHYVALHETMLGLMRRYDSEIRKIYPSRNYFFPSRSGKSFHDCSWVEWNFRNIWQNCNIADTIPYDLRHNYAVENINQWIGKSFDFSKLVYLSKSMGYCELESTKYYYHLVPALSDIVDDLSGQSFDEIVPEAAYEKS